MSLIEIDQVGDSPPGESHYAVDLVFVHGLREGGVESWTDAKTGVLWIRTLFPNSKYNARRLIYEYDAERLLTPGALVAGSIYDEAVGLVNHLNADRELLNAQERPIIFVCHEFGGLLVKRALAYSFSRSDAKINHLRCIYTSTYAILFMSTPHLGFQRKALSTLHSRGGLGPNLLALSLLERSDTLQEITDQFGSIQEKFHVSNFWEQQKTTHENDEFFIVERDSAAPPWHDVVRGGINATHSGMIKFSSEKSPGYRLVLATLNKHLRFAAETIAQRWEEDRDLRKVNREHEVDNLVRPAGHASSHSMPMPNKTPLTSKESLETQNSGSDGSGTRSLNVHCFVRLRSEYFVGRQRQMDSLREIFGVDKSDHLSSASPKVYVIYGLPGSGKTQFCLRYLEENRHRYWGVFWIDCTTEATAEESFALLGQVSGKGVAPGAGRRWLSQTLDPWLLVLDNANDPDFDLNGFIPASGNGHVIVNARNPVAKKYKTLGAVKFQGLDPEEAVTMLLALAYPDKDALYRSSNRKKAAVIASELGYLALALKQAAFHIRENLLPLERYLQSLCGCRKALLSRHPIQSAMEANIAATWEIPFSGISDQKTVKCRDAVELLHLLAFFHFASIPISIFTQCFNGLKSANHLKMRPRALLESSSMQEVDDRIRRAARVLYENSIISLSESDVDADGAGASRRKPKLFFGLHPAIHQWARERLDPEDSRAWLDCAVTILQHAISTNMEMSGHAFRRLLLPHIESCLQQLRATSGIGQPSRAPGLGEVPQTTMPRSPEEAAYLERFALVYAEAGRWNDAKPLQRNVVNFYGNHYGRAHNATISAKRRLANTDWNLFHIEECVKLQADIFLTQKIVRPSLADYFCWPVTQPTYLSHMQTLDDLTKCLWQAGDLDRSRRAGEQCVAVLTRRLGPDDPLTVSAMFNLGRTYQHMGGRPDKALDLLRHALGRREHFFGSDHPDTLMVVNELGAALCAGRQQLGEAESLVRRAWEARKRVLGEEHAYTLWSANDLSMVLVERKRFDEAKALLEEVIITVRRTLGERHAGMAMAKGNLTKACVRSGDWTRARELLVDLEEIFPAEKFEGRPDRLYLEWGWAYVKLYHDGDLNAAEAHCETVLRVVSNTQILAANNPRVLDAAQMLKRIYEFESRDEDLQRLKLSFPDVGNEELRSSVEILPLG